MSKKETNSNLRYDGYYLWISRDFTAECLQFSPNGVVGYTFQEKGEILGIEYNDEPVSKSLIYKLIHKFVLEKFPPSKDSEFIPYYYRGKYQTDGQYISFKIDQYDLILTFRGRILKDSLDLLRIFAIPQLKDNISSTIIFEFVAFEF